MLRHLYKNFRKELVKMGDSPDLFDFESFESLYESLKEDEQEMLVDEETDAQDKTMIYMLMATRGKDYAAGYTDMDEDGILHLSANSTMLELPITMASYIELAGAGCTTIKDAMEIKDVSEFVYADVERALESLRNDGTVHLEDF